MNEELCKAIIEGAYQVCIYGNKVAIWVKGEDARNKILLNARGMNAEVSKMRGNIYVIKINLDNAIHEVFG